MGTCIEKLPHSCGTRSGLQVFAGEGDEVNGFCFSCGEFVAHPYGEPKKLEDIPQKEEKSEAEKAAELAEIDGYPTVTIPSRKLKKTALEFFGVKVGLSEQDGKTPYVRYFPYTKGGEVVAYKAKTCNNEKRMWTVGAMKGVDWFGWREAIASGAKRIIIATGEDDAVAIRRSLELHTKPEYRDHMPAVVSLPFGDGNAAKAFTEKKGELKQYFKEFVLAFDMDKSGQNAAEAVSKIFPEVVVAALPAKDANQALFEGKHLALFKAVMFNIAPKKRSKLKSAADVWEQAKQPAQWGQLSWPWQGLQELTRGIRYGETYYIGAGVKMGKSELLNALAAHFIMNNNAKVMLAKPEESNAKTIKLLAGKVEGKVFHDPKVPFDEEAFERAGQFLKDQDMVRMLDLYQHVGWEDLKEDIIEAIEWGAKAVFIDPITNLTNGMPADKANVMLQEIAQALSAMAKDYNVAIFIFCHLKAPEGNINKDVRLKKYDQGIYTSLGNCPHELGGDVLSAQFAGSRAMMRSCNYMIGLEGNKDDELEEHIRNIRQLHLLEDREFGESGRIQLRWDRATTLFREA